MGAIIARHAYLASLDETPAWRLEVAERNMRNENMLEPHILEGMAVLGYRLAGQEALWIPRALSACFWLLGAGLLYRIALRLTSQGGGVVAVTLFLFMPFAILASRSFQPDPLMVFLELAGVLALMRFAERECMSRLLVAAAVCAAAVFVKPVCLSLLLGVYGVASWCRHGLLRTLTNRYTWTLALALGGPVAFYAWKVLSGAGASDLGSQAEGSIVPALLLTTSFWRGVLAMLARVIGVVPLLLALAGLVLTTERRPHTGSLAGMWLGYALFVMVFSYHTHTHDYYHLQVIPIAALSIGSIAAVGLGMFVLPSGAWRRRALAGLLLCVGVLAASALGLVAFLSRPHAVAPHWGKPVAEVVGAACGIPRKFVAYVRPESIGMSAQVAVARAVGEAVNHTAHTVFLGEDGGEPLIYLGEFSGVRWPAHGNLWKSRLLGEEVPSAAERLSRMLRQEPELEYFVVTDFGDLARQPELEQVLAGYSVASRGSGYTVYSLRR